MYELKLRADFDAAHLLLGFLQGHKCGRLHGHTWEVEVTLRAVGLNEWGLSVDFGLLRELLRKALPDHRMLNAATYLGKLADEFPKHRLALEEVGASLGNWIDQPTAERLAERLYNDLVSLMGELEVIVVSVEVWESSTAAARYPARATA